MSHSEILKNYFSILNQYSLHPNSASQSHLLQRFSKTPYLTTKNVSITALYANPKMFKRSAPETDSSASSNPCGYPCNDNTCTLDCTSENQSISSKYQPIKLGFAANGQGNYSAKTTQTFYMYYLDGNNDTTNSACYATNPNNLYTMSFSACLMSNTTSGYTNNTTYQCDLLKAFGGWYWGFKYKSGLNVSNTYPNGTWNIVSAPVINNAKIKIDLNVKNDCYNTPTVSMVCSTSTDSFGFTFPGMTVDSTNKNNVVGSPQPSQNPQYQCQKCCYDWTTSNCPNSNCTPLGVISFWMYFPGQINVSGKPWYNLTTVLNVDSVVVGYKNDGGVNNNIKKWLFWYNQIDANEYNIDNFSIQYTQPPGSNILSSHTITGTGIANIEIDSSGDFYVVNSSTYWNIGDTLPGVSGDTTTPYSTY
jgi:hypothetical protein